MMVFVGRAIRTRIQFLVHCFIELNHASRMKVRVLLVDAAAQPAVAVPPLSGGEVVQASKRTAAGGKRPPGDDRGGGGAPADVQEAVKKEKMAPQTLVPPHPFLLLPARALGVWAEISREISATL